MSSAPRQASHSSQASQATRSAELRSDPGTSSLLENLSLQETLRVMDVAREMRERRETAEEMFRRDDLRANLREKLLRTARLSGDTVTEAEIDAAIGQYMDTLYTFHDPASGLDRLIAHGWVWRNRIMAGIVAAAGIVGTFWFVFG